MIGLLISLAINCLLVVILLGMHARGDSPLDAASAGWLSLSHWARTWLDRVKRWFT